MTQHDKNTYWKKFGESRSDDLSSLEQSSERAFTLEDGATTLEGMPSIMWDMVKLMRLLKVYRDKWTGSGIDHSVEEVVGGGKCVLIVNGVVIGRAKGVRYGGW